jgi:serine/threonine protein kinase
MLGIGPKIKLDMGFDVVCYRNCIEFYMERCDSFAHHFSISSYDKIQRRLKYCMAVMHEFRLIHKDIKPHNILFSRSLNDFVFCDFGISVPVAEPLGFMTCCYREGTADYISPQMRFLPEDKEAYVDLYFNDFYGLRVTLANISK